MLNSVLKGYMGTHREEDRKILENLPHGKECTVSWFEESGGLVYRLWDVYVLFEVPQYGGEANYVGTFHYYETDKLLDVVYSWN